MRNAEIWADLDSDMALAEEHRNPLDEFYDRLNADAAECVNRRKDESQFERDQRTLDREFAKIGPLDRPLWLAAAAGDPQSIRVLAAQLGMSEGAARAEANAYARWWNGK
jgi:Lon protease-like protein